MNALPKFEISTFLGRSFIETVSTFSKEILGNSVIGTKNFVQFTTFSPERARLDGYVGESLGTGRESGSQNDNSSFSV